MRKIPTNSPATRRKAELPLDLIGPHITEGASSQHRLYQALCHAITGGIAKPGEPLPPQRTLAKQTGFRREIESGVELSEAPAILIGRRPAVTVRSRPSAV